MISIVLLNKRKPGITKEQFLEHYERSHAPMATRVFGHLFTSYTRNYIHSQGQHASNTNVQGESGADVQWDCVTAITFAKKEDLEEMRRLVQEPETLAMFLADEEHFLDRSAKTVFGCDQLQTLPIS